MDQIVGMSTFKKLLSKITGDEATFTLEHRIFNTTSLFITSFGVIGGIANYLLGLHPATVWLAGVGVVIAFCFFYQSRFNNAFGTRPVFGFVFATLIVLGPIHFFNGGLQGNVIYLMIMLLNIFLLVVQRKYQFVICTIYYVSFLALLFLEYYYPGWVVPYRNIEERIADHTVTMFYSLFYTAIVISVFRKSYDNEREKVKNQYEQVTVLNKQIDQQLKDLEAQKLELAEAVQIANDKNEKNKILLKELNHRVKNNLQVVSSLLNLQSQSIADDKARSAILESKNRLLAMVLIHQRLYHNENATQIFMPDYLQDLVRNIMFTYSSAEPDQTFIYRIDRISLSVEHAITVGLICNELITNFFKYVFPDGGKLEIELKKDPDQYKLVVWDNGKGFTENKTKKTFGLKLIHTLVKQVNGSSEVTFDHGTRWTIQFKG